MPILLAMVAPWPGSRNARSARRAMARGRPIGQLSPPVASGGPGFILIRLTKLAGGHDMAQGGAHNDLFGPVPVGLVGNRQTHLLPEVREVAGVVVDRLVENQVQEFRLYLG